MEGLFDIYPELREAWTLKEGVREWYKAVDRTYAEATLNLLERRVTVSVGIYLYARATWAANKFYTVTGKGFRPRVLDLGRWRYVTAVLVLVVPVLQILPVITLLWVSFQRYYIHPSWEALSLLTLSNYTKVLISTNVVNSLKNSLIISVVSASFAAMLTAISVWIVVRTKLRGRRYLDFLTSFPLVFPGIVLGIAVIRTYLAIPVPIYDTIWIIVVAYIVRYLPYATRFCHPALLQIHPELEESAYVSGSSWWTAFRTILVPLMMPALFGAWVWIFMVSVRELSVAAILSGPKTQVVAVTLFELWSNGQITEVAAFGTVLAAILVVIALAFHRLSRKYGVQV